MNEDQTPVPVKGATLAIASAATALVLIVFTVPLTTLTVTAHALGAGPGEQAWILSANLDAMKYIGLRPSVKKMLLNGRLKCRFCAYDLFKGKRKDQFDA